MTSLFRLLFDTMPLSNAEGAAYDQTSLPLDRQTVGLLGEQMRCVATQAYWKHENPPINSALHVMAKEGAVPRQSVPIWGYDATGDVASVQNITCRVQGDDFKKYLVLEDLSFGHIKNGKWESSVAVQIGEQHFALPLSNQSRLVTFMTQDGRNPGSHHPLWPLSAWEDCGLLHVHVFDIELITGNVTYLSQLPPGHPDEAELAKFVEACDLFSRDSSEDQLAGKTLFNDNLWREWGSGADDLIGAVVAAANDLVRLRVTTVRVVVCTSLTLNRAFDDYVSGRVVWMARAYPHIMVASTLPLRGLTASIRFHRPALMTIEDDLPCGCGEMNSAIETLLVSDNNAGNVGTMADGVVADSAAPPLWNRIFGYAVPSAYAALRGARVRVVKRGRHSPSHDIWIDGAVARMGDLTNNRVLRTVGQGVFDNIHMAPSMKFPPTSLASTLPGAFTAPTNSAYHDIKLTSADRSSWHLDDVRMAPFCAHDCFHMHWRWMNAWPDDFLAGWSGDTPNSAPGAPMVPENQDVYIQVLAPATVLYEVEAGPMPNEKWIPANTWQVICHHGAGYASDVSSLVTLLREVAHNRVFGQWTEFEVSGRKVEWAKFYWNLRFFVAPDAKAPLERVAIIDLQALIDA